MLLLLVLTLLTNKRLLRISSELLRISQAASVALASSDLKNSELYLLSLRLTISSVSLRLMQLPRSLLNLLPPLLLSKALTQADLKANLTFPTEVKAFGEYREKSRKIGRRQDFEDNLSRYLRFNYLKSMRIITLDEKEHFRKVKLFFKMKIKFCEGFMRSDGEGLLKIFR